MRVQESGCGKRIRLILFATGLGLAFACFLPASATGQEPESSAVTSPADQVQDEWPVWGTLKGQFRVVGEVPEAPDEAVDKDAGICVIDGQMPKDDNLVVDAGSGLRDVFVMMLLSGDEPVPVHPRYAAAEPRTLVLDNAKCRFEPHALAIRTGEKLILRNSDEVGHNCHIITFGNEENVNLAQLSEVEVVLKNADKVPGNVVCDIHKWMDAVILVRDEPCVAISAADGTFAVPDVPAGTWSFQFWHKKAGYLRDLKIEGHEPGRRGEIELTLAEGETIDLGVMELPVESLSK
jgi:plastocyanin